MKLKAFENSLKTFAPPPELTVSEWADANRVLSPEASAESGRWSTDRAPYQRAMMDAVNDPDINEIVIKTSAQVGKTEILNNIVGYFIQYDPSPMLFVQPTLSMAETHSKDRLAPMLRDTPSLRRIFENKTKSRKSNNTLLHKSFHGGHITLAGSNSPASLASRPVRIVLFDEVDRFPFSAGTEGDPVSLGKKRTSTFFNRLSVMVSTPTIKGASRIEYAYDQSDKRRYFVPCPKCDHMQALEFQRLKWPSGEPDKTYYECESCEYHIEHHEKHEMLAMGEWVKTNPEIKGTAGFHLNEMYSPWKTWSEIASDYLKAKKNEEMLKTFWNTSLGLEYEAKGESPDHELLFKRSKNYMRGQVPNEVYFLTCAIDVQKDRFEAEICGWGKNKNSYSIDYRVIPANPSDLKEYGNLDQLLSEVFVRDDGMQLPILKAGIDSGGHDTQTVYDWARSYSESRLICIKGQKALSQYFKMPQNLNKRARNKRKFVRVWQVGTDFIKREIYSFLKQSMPSDEEISTSGYPYGFCHFPEGYGEEYYRMLTAEVEEVKIIKGFPVYYFVKKYDRNEALDVRVYNRAVASTIGYDAFTDQQFENILKKSTGLDPTSKTTNKVKIKRRKSSYLK